MKLDTVLVRFDAAPGDPSRPTSTPIHQTATFAQESAVELGAFDYTRSGNPTRRVLEEQVARLEGGGQAFAFASGMAAVTAVTRLLAPGQRVLAGTDLYGGTFRLLDRCLARSGVAVDWIDVTDPSAVEAALRAETRLVLLETPSNPMQRVADIRALAAACRPRGVLLAVDNSLMSPYLQRPLELGADLVLHSATKHLGGHGDLVAGLVTAADPKVASELGFLQNAEGAGLAPFDSWLLLRGMKTLGVRLERAQANAQRIAQALARHPLVARVHYVGLSDHPGHAVHRSQAKGPGSVLAFETGSRELSRSVVERVELFTIAVSFGSVSSQISLPCCMSHASIPAAVRRARALPEDLVRLSIGIEDPCDLIEDLERALGAARSRVNVGSLPGSPARSGAR